MLPSRSPLHTTMKILLGLIVVTQLTMIFQVNFHPDEFRELTSLFSKESGYVIGPLKNGLHYLIWPLKYTSLNEGHIMIIARYVTYLGVLGIYWMLFKLGELLGDELLGLFAAFLCATVYSFFESAIQYRPDPINTAFFLGAVYLVIKNAPSQSPFFVPGLLIGIALFFNPKTVYHFAFLGLVYGYFLFTAKERLLWFKSGVLCALVAVGVFAVTLFLHCVNYQLPFFDDSDFRKAASVGFGDLLGWPLKKQFLSAHLFRALLQGLCMVGGMLMVVHGLVKGKLDRRWWPMLIVALAHLSTLAYHQGVFKYYIIHILPTAALLGGFFLHRLATQNYPMALLNHLKYLGLCLLLLGIAVRLPLNLTKTNENQLHYMRYAHELYPEPVDYFDGFGMISRYNNVGGLFIGKSITAYRLREEPIYPNWTEERFPAFMIHSHSFNFNHLLNKDKDFVFKHFVPLFGRRLWLHGFQVPPGKKPEEVQRTFYLSGWYSHNGKQLTVDGKAVDTPFFLEKGTYHLHTSGQDPVQVTFGKHLPQEVVPNVTVPPGKSTLQVAVAGNYYPRYKGNNKAIMLDGREISQTRWPEKEISVYLSAGEHTFENPNAKEITMDVLGPVFVLETWSIFR